MVRGCLSFIINLINLFSIFSIQANAAPNFIYNCNTSNNFTDNNLYKPNLNQLLLGLTSQASYYPFNNLTARSEPDQVYALYYYRGDLTSEDCNDCVTTAANEIVSRRPVAKEAIVWYEECTFQYSNITIFSVDEEGLGWLSWSSANVSNTREFLVGIATIVDQLTKQAVVNPSLRNYANGSSNITELQTIYCLVQCTPDLNLTQCERCLKEARIEIPHCCSSGSTYTFVNLPSCHIMYDIIPFGPPSPPPDDA